MLVVGLYIDQCQLLYLPGHLSKINPHLRNKLAMDRRDNHTHCFTERIKNVASEEHTVS